MKKDSRQLFNLGMMILTTFFLTSCGYRVSCDTCEDFIDFMDTLEAEYRYSEGMDIETLYGLHQQCERSIRELRNKNPEVARLVMEYLSNIKDCYESRLANDPMDKAKCWRYYRIRQNIEGLCKQ